MSNFCELKNHKTEEKIAEIPTCCCGWITVCETCAKLPIGVLIEELSCTFR